MFEKEYKSYVKKCRELKIKPSSKESLFVGEIQQKSNNTHQNIEELSRARKDNHRKRDAA